MISDIQIFIALILVFISSFLAVRLGITLYI